MSFAESVSLFLRLSVICNLHLATGNFKGMEASTAIGIVGPCAAGKTTLVNRLKDLGYEVHHIAQEHSFVPDMWLQVVSPKILIYLDVTFSESINRRPSDMTPLEFREQEQRLIHARQHADLYIQTSDLSPDEVFERVIAYLEKRGIRPRI